MKRSPLPSPNSPSLPAARSPQPPCGAARVRCLREFALTVREGPRSGYRRGKPAMWVQRGSDICACSDSCLRRRKRPTCSLKSADAERGWGSCADRATGFYVDKRDVGLNRDRDGNEPHRNCQASISSVRMPPQVVANGSWDQLAVNRMRVLEVFKMGPTCVSRETLPDPTFRRCNPSGNTITASLSSVP